MSIIKNFIQHINELPLNSVFSVDDISKKVRTKNLLSTYPSTYRYLEYLYNAKLIEIDHKELNEIFLIKYGISGYDNFYIKKIDMPITSTTTIQLLKKLATDESYRKNYMRKHKLTQLRNVGI
jgi:hypothetical protein